MTEQDQKLLPIFDVMEQFSDLLMAETETLSSGKLDGLKEIVADKSMYVHKYSNLAQKILTPDGMTGLSNAAKNALRDKTASLLALIEENELAITRQQQAHDVVIKLFQQSVEMETKPVTYKKPGAQTPMTSKNPALTLNEKA